MSTTYIFQIKHPTLDYYMYLESQSGVSQLIKSFEEIDQQTVFGPYYHATIDGFEYGMQAPSMDAVVQAFFFATKEEIKEGSVFDGCEHLKIRSV